MDVETERLERRSVRSPRRVLHVDSTEEGNSEGPTSYPASDVSNNVLETLSENLHQDRMVSDGNDIESAMTESESFSKITDTKVTTLRNDEVPMCDKSFQERVAFEEDARDSFDSSERTGLTVKPSSDFSKNHATDAVSEKENTFAGELSHATDTSALDGANSTEEQEFTGKLSNAVSGLHEGGHLNETHHSEKQLNLGSSDIHKAPVLDVIGADDAKLSSDPLDDVVKAHGDGQDSVSEVKIPTLEQINDVKEPEEQDHKESCKILQDENLEEETQEQNKTAEEADGWLYVLGHDKLKKRVIKKGLENTRPLRGQIVILNCIGHLEDGTQVDKHENLSITLGDGDFIHAFDLCVALMDKGETSEVVTESRFAYGELGREPDVPPNAFISYIIELVDCHNMPAYSTLSIADRIKLSDAKRERGNYLYSRNEFSRSIDLYTKALKALDEDFQSHEDSAEDMQQLSDTEIKCHNNMAAAQMKVEAWDAAIKSCDAVLKVQPDNVKALFRKAKCFANKGDISTAIPLLKRALKLEPETKIIHQELSRLEKKIRAQAETEKALYQKMLGTDKEPVGGKKKKNTGGAVSKWLWYVAGGLAAVLLSVGFAAYKSIQD